MPKNSIQAIVLFGSVLVKKEGHWQTAGFEKDFLPGTVGGKLRVLAGYYLFNELKSPIIVLSGRRKEKEFKNTPIISSVIKKELVELGLPAKKIIIEENSSNTYQNLLYLIEILKKKKFNTILVLSSKYHLPRIKAMIKRAPNLSELSKLTKIKYLSAESVLLKKNPQEWRTVIKKAYTGKNMKELMKKEAAGVKDIINGHYKYN